MAKPQVKQDQSGIWLAAPLAAKKLGLTKPELARLALAENLTFQEDRYGNPVWYLEPEIAALAKVHFEQARAKSAKPKKPKTERQTMRDIERAPSRPKKHGVASGREVQLTVPWGKGILPNS